MPPLPCALTPVSGACALLFATRVFEPATLVLVGAVLAPGKRTVTAALRVLGRGDDSHFPNLHRVRNRAHWAPLDASRILLSLLLEAFVPEEPVVLGFEEARERRRGKRRSAKGLSRAPVRSSPTHLVKASGRRWVSRLVLTRMPWVTRVWALPLLTVLAPSARYEQARGRRPPSLLERARQAWRLVRRWPPTREQVVVGDRTYAALEWLEAGRQTVCVITHLRLDAALDAPAPPREPKPNGRPRKQGRRLPTLAQVVAHPSTHWQTVTIAQGYGRGER